MTREIVIVVVLTVVLAGSSLTRFIMGDRAPRGLLRFGPPIGPGTWASQMRRQGRALAGEPIDPTDDQERTPRSNARLWSWALAALLLINITIAVLQDVLN